MLDDAAIQRIKDSSHLELSVSHGRGRNNAEFEETLRQRLDAIFERYVPRATEIHREAWKRRSAVHKLKDHAAYLINELL